MTHSKRTADDITVDGEPEKQNECLQLKRRFVEASCLDSVAVVTMARDEGFFFPIWLRYYSRAVKPHCIFVLDHETGDGSLDLGFTAALPESASEKDSLERSLRQAGSPFVRCMVQHEYFCDEKWRLKTVESAVASLLGCYNMVIFGDTDELIVPVDGSLSSFLSCHCNNPPRVLRCTGFEVHHADSEAPFDPSRSVFEQRSFWFPNKDYSKPAVVSAPVKWNAGFHTLSQEDTPEPCGQLVLVHLHRVDRARSLLRHQRYAASCWNPSQSKRWGWQYRETDEESIDKTFDRFWENRAALEPIPACWKHTGV